MELMEEQNFFLLSFFFLFIEKEKYIFFTRKLRSNSDEKKYIKNYILYFCTQEKFILRKIILASIV